MARIMNTVIPFRSTRLWFVLIWYTRVVSVHIIMDGYFQDVYLGSTGHDLNTNHTTRNPNWSSIRVGANME